MYLAARRRGAEPSSDAATLSEFGLSLWALQMVEREENGTGEVDTARAIATRLR